MFATDDTIVAIATPLGRGALGIVRIGGPRSQAIAALVLDHPTPLEPRHATLTRVRDQSSRERGFDEVVVTLFTAPQSYSGEDIVEICAHGSPVVLASVLRAAQAAGARLAAPGEFTLRAFLNGKRDLIQAEAVADLIDASTPLQARVAFDQLDGTLTESIEALDALLLDLVAQLEASLDFPDEGYHFIEPSRVAHDIAAIIGRVDDLLGSATAGRMIREGATVVIAGRTNVGKSSLFNTLAGADRAIVTSIPGTTRDLVTEVIDVEGIAVTLVDTAGSRDASDAVEQAGVERASKARAVADLVLLVLDQSEPLTDVDRALIGETVRSTRVVVINKSDLDCRIDESMLPTDVVRVSAAHDKAFDTLRRAIARSLMGEERLRDAPLVTNSRHVTLLEECRGYLDAAYRAAEDDHATEEFLLTDLHAARVKLDEIAGRRTSEDVLKHIFERFCVGK